MRELLESLDISAELKYELSESFEDAVERAVSQKSEEYEDYVQEQISEMKADFEDKISAYLEMVVENFIDENKFQIEESVKTEKVNALLEGFDSLMLTSGVSLAQIAEAKEAHRLDESVVDNSAMVDKLMSENMNLKHTVEDLTKMGLISEISKNMTILEQKKFQNLAELVEFKEPRKYVSSLEEIAESIRHKTVSKRQSYEINEDVKTTNDKYVSIAKHLF